MKTQHRTCLILGAASAVAVAFARKTCAGDPVRFILAGRNEVRLKEILADLIARGASAESALVVGDLGDAEKVASLSEAAFSLAGTVDEVLIAYGQLGEHPELQKDLGKVRQLLEVNFLSAALWCEAVASLFDTQEFGKLAVIGSVAGDRGRQSNYLYGSAKAGLERVCEGLSHRFAGRKRISVTLIKPGFIDTPMTDHLRKSGPLWAKPEEIAATIRHAMDNNRVRIYAPWYWRWIMLVVRCLPVPIMHRTKL